MDHKSELLLGFAALLLAGCAGDVGEGKQDVQVDLGEVKVTGIEYTSLWPGSGGLPDSFPTALSHLIGTVTNGTPNPLVRVRVTNFGRTAAAVNARVDLPGYASPGEETISLEPTESKIVSVSPRLDLARLFALTTRVPASIEVTVTANGASTKESHDIEILGRNELNLQKVVPFASAFVTPNEKTGALTGLLTDAAQLSAWRKLDGYQMLGLSLKETYSIQPNGAYDGSFTYLDAGEVLQLQVESLSASPANFYIFDGVSFQAMKGGAQTDPKFQRLGVSAGTTFSFTAPTAGLYYYVFENRSSIALTVSSVRAAHRWDVVWDQARALYTALQKRPMSYVHAPGGNTWWDGVQVVRYPSEVLRDRSYTCIEGAILLASAFERLGMQPLLQFIPGHVFVGVRIGPSMPVIIWIEQNMIPTSSFYEAWLQGNVDMQQATIDRQLDIMKLRQAGNLPAPM